MFCVYTREYMCGFIDKNTAESSSSYRYYYIYNRYFYIYNSNRIYALKFIYTYICLCVCVWRKFAKKSQGRAVILDCARRSRRQAHAFFAHAEHMILLNFSYVRVRVTSKYIYIFFFFIYNF